MKTRQYPPQERLIDWLKPYARQNSTRFISQEIFGSALPHIALGMNRNDRIDQFYQKTSQVVGSYVTTFAFSKWVEHQFNRLETSSLKHQPSEWKELGVALATLPLFAATSFSAINFRNYLSSKTFKTHDFTDMVGLSHHHSQLQETEASKQKRHAYERQELNTVGKAMGCGVALSAVGGFWAFQHMKHGKPLPKWLKRTIPLPSIPGTTKSNPQQHLNLFNMLSFKNGSVKHIKPMHVLTTFGVFGYWSEILSARSPVEQFESYVKLGWYGLANIVIPALIARKLSKTLDRLGKGDPERRAVFDFLAETTSGALLYAMPPTLACVLSRRKRTETLEQKAVKVDEKILDRQS